MTTTGKYDVEHVLYLPHTNVMAIFTYKPAIVKANLIAEVHSLKLISFETQQPVIDSELKILAMIEFLKAERVYNSDMN